MPVSLTKRYVTSAEEFHESLVWRADYGDLKCRTELAYRAGYHGPGTYDWPPPYSLDAALNFTIRRNAPVLSADNTRSPAFFSSRDGWG